MRTVKIYTLTNPNTNMIYYVGATSKSLRERLNNHRSSSFHKTTRCLYTNGQEPIIEEVEDCSISIASEREEYWMNYFLETGCQLENVQIKSYITKNLYYLNR